MLFTKPIRFQVKPSEWIHFPQMDAFMRSQAQRRTSVSNITVSSTSSKVISNMYNQAIYM